MSRDEDHLRLLSIFHYVLAGLSCLLALLPILYVGMGALMLRAPHEGAEEEMDTRTIGWVIIAAGAVLAAVFLTLASCLAMAGRCLARRSRYLFCLVMAAVACLFIPLGTALGVCTIAVLQRDTVRRAFDPSPRAAGA
jgi:uncharacterized BrkB/YihY/UPF0761 family membrane protein